RADEPANRQALLPRAVDLHRHLVGGTTDALGADLDGRLHVFDSVLEDFDRVSVRHALLDLVERAIEDPGGGGLLALPHQTVDELAGQLVLVTNVRFQGRFAGGAFASHGCGLNLNKINFMLQLAEGNSPAASSMRAPPAGGPVRINSSKAPRAAAALSCTG